MTFDCIYTGNSVQIFRINAHVYYRMGDLDGRRQCNGGFIVLEDCTAVVDVPSMDGAKELLEESLELFHKPVRYAFLTHPHPDHDLGLPLFAKENGIRLFASKKAYAELDAQGILYPDDHFGIEGRLHICLQGVDIVLENIGITAHSPWDMLVHLPQYGILFTGDLVVPNQIFYLEHCDFGPWLSTLGALSERSYQILARGHGELTDQSAILSAMQYIRAMQQLNAYMRAHIVLSAEEQSEENMATLLRKMVACGCPGASGMLAAGEKPAAYQLTQFYRFSPDSALNSSKEQHFEAVPAH